LNEPEEKNAKRENLPALSLDSVVLGEGGDCPCSCNVNSNAITAFASVMEEAPLFNKDKGQYFWLFLFFHNSNNIPSIGSSLYSPKVGSPNEMLESGRVTLPSGSLLPNFGELVTRISNEPFEANSNKQVRERNQKEKKNNSNTN
jgi:hypothetical protein